MKKLNKPTKFFVFFFILMGFIGFASPYNLKDLFDGPLFDSAYTMSKYDYTRVEESELINAYVHTAYVIKNYQELMSHANKARDIREESSLALDKMYKERHEKKLVRPDNTEVKRLDNLHQAEMDKIKDLVVVLDKEEFKAEIVDDKIHISGFRKDSGFKDIVVVTQARLNVIKSRRNVPEPGEAKTRLMTYKRLSEEDYKRGYFVVELKEPDLGFANIAFDYDSPPARKQFNSTKGFNQRISYVARYLRDHTTGN